ncbi:ABC transporter ATP-binding protein [Pelagovum pacificum]|uniref:ABC transporter ATP-binding protein n=1 Tax=Pelagovum pacificum TaxID=2588711 RepID=A0A5C5G955_9RHOB|nr:ABC transporter ATP-binding protein [Pelagovum pacificum]QQA42170.1 ABC transporter ATP-binding protein [Pelagovum pacificum]TNY31256.1 ABC transporter ATP-binding protein [Pelagovum pacificum]
MASGAALTIEIREKRFDVLPEPLFADFELEIAPSSVVALLGPSGIGKSTLLRMVAGVDTDFTGRITLDGVEAAAAAPPGFVFQDPRLLPWLDAVGNIRAAGPSVTETHARELLADMGLSGFEGALPHELSGGMQRRVGVARALAAEPGLLLLDEPFVSLDEALVQELQTLVLNVIDRRRPTVLLVSHAATDAARLGDRVVILSRDGIAADITPDVPRSERSAEDRARIAQDLAQRMEALR